MQMSQYNLFFKSCLDVNPTLDYHDVWILYHMLAKKKKILYHISPIVSNGLWVSQAQHICRRDSYGPYSSEPNHARMPFISDLDIWPNIFNTLSSLWPLHSMDRIMFNIRPEQTLAWMVGEILYFHNTYSLSLRILLHVPRSIMVHWFEWSKYVVSIDVGNGDCWSL